jgi:predicted ribonuclease toxin of YeeF-YezG toxin-antitoxin module
VHFVLGAAGFIPGLGAVPDLLDAGVYALEGDMVNAGLSAAAAVPFAGDAVKAGTLTGKAGKQVAKAAAERTAKEAAEKVAKEAAERLAKEAAEKAAKVRAAKEAAEKEAAERAAKNKATDGVKFRKRRFPPNATFEHNGYLYKTDAQGRVVEVSGELKLDKAQRNTYAQRMAGADDGRLATDQGGHLIGSQFGGTGQPINLVPMDAKVNSSSMANGTWGRMEQQWAEQLSQKNTVVVKIEPIYKTETARPDFFNVTQQINGKTTYKTIFNRPGG